jgi:hypothetical protein
MHPQKKTPSVFYGWETHQDLYDMVSLSYQALEVTTGSQSDGVIQFKEAPDTLQRPHLQQNSKTAARPQQTYLD